MTAAAAHALGLDTPGTVTGGFDGAASAVDDHLGAFAALGATAADGHTDSHADRNAAAAVTAAAAHTLGEDCASIFLGCDELSAVCYRDRISVAAAAPAASEREPAFARTAAPTTAADTLCKNGVGGGSDTSAIGDRDGTAFAGATGLPANGDQPRGVPAVTPTTADALGIDPAGVLTKSPDYSLV